MYWTHYAPGIALMGLQALSNILSFIPHSILRWILISSYFYWWEYEMLWIDTFLPQRFAASRKVSLWDLQLIFHRASGTPYNSQAVQLILGAVIGLSRDL